MPSCELYAGVDYWMPHEQVEMRVPVMLPRRTGCETAASGLQYRLTELRKIRPFTHDMVRPYVRFYKRSEQIDSVLDDFGYRHRRKVARLFQRRIRFIDIVAKTLRTQMFDLESVNDIQVRILPVRRNAAP